MHEIDCLLLAYSGFGIANRNELLKSYGSIKVDRPFNMAIAYLGTYLHRNGFSFDYINSIEDEQELLLDKLRTKKILSVGISTTFCDDIKQVTKMISTIKQVNPEIKIILGGPYIVEYVHTFSELSEAALYLSLRKVKADFIIDSFYGEELLAGILSAIKSDYQFDKIPNIYYKCNNNFFHTSRVDQNIIIENNNVDWDLFSDRLGNSVSVRTSISCNFSCAFCNYPINAGKYKCLDVEKIEAELDSIEKLKKVKYINFIDDTFNIPQNRFKDILRMIISKRYSFFWYGYIRCQYLDLETVSLMKKSGCIGVFLGIESGNNDILKNMNKNTNVDAYLRGMSLLNEYDIISYASFIIGFPGESLSTVQDTISFIEEAKPTFYNMGSWFYDPRTPIHKEKKKYLLTGSHNSWFHKSMDFATAEKIVKEIKHTIKNSILGSDKCDVIFQILKEGLSLEQTKEYLEIIKIRNYT